MTGKGTGKNGNGDICFSSARRFDMDTALTRKEIEAQFDGQWVLIEDPITDATLEVHGGIVRFHSTEAHEVYKRAAELQLPRTAILFIGRMPKKMEYVL